MGREDYKVGLLFACPTFEVFMSKLKIYIDESGDFGFTEKSSELYVVSFVFHDTSKSLKTKIDFLNKKLKSLNYNGMIHTAELIANRKEYAKMELEDRKSLFLALFYFALKCDIKTKSIIVNKKYLNNKSQLRNNIKQKIYTMLDNDKEYFSKFDSIIIYYDNGQERLMNILKKCFSIFNIKIIKDFNHVEERLFQVADMLCVLEKITNLQKNKVKFNNQEKYFFKSLELLNKIKDINKKNLP